jgi:hypothetical protein
MTGGLRGPSHEALSREPDYEHASISFLMLQSKVGILKIGMPRLMSICTSTRQVSSAFWAPTINDKRTSLRLIAGG